MMSPTGNGSNGGTRFCLMLLLPKYGRTSLEEQAIIYGDETSAHHGTGLAHKRGLATQGIRSRQEPGGTDDAITDIVKPAGPIHPGHQKLTWQEPLTCQLPKLAVAS